MKISGLSERVTFQKNTVVTDEIGNHTNTWEDCFSCAAAAAASSYKQGETQKAGVTAAEEGMVFTVRHCPELDGLDTTHYRVRFRDGVYNITSVDRMNYGHRSIRVSCSRERF